MAANASTADLLKDSGVNLDRAWAVALGDPEFLVELIDVYLDDAPRQVEALVQAVQAENGAETRRLAHRLRGASANLGIETLAEACAELEAEAADPQTSDTDRWKVKARRVVSIFPQVQRALEALRRGCSSGAMSPPRPV